MSEIKKFSLIRTTIDTPFHIDFDWWKDHDQNWRVYLLSCLCEDHQNSFREQGVADYIDWVDMKTGEVKQVDGLQVVLMNHCAQQLEFISNYTTLVDSVFRVLLANGNNPLTSRELSARTGRPSETILKTLSGIQVYKGLRPLHN